MTTYRGNKGNLLQHWTLCEILNALACRFNSDSILHFFSGHAMAPLASPGKTSQTRHIFERCQSLRAQNSRYEQAWFELVPATSRAYPSSAHFVTHIWKGPFALTLCEQDTSTINAIEAWRSSSHRNKHVRDIRLHRGDWRSLPPPLNRDCDVQLLEFDPYRFNVNDEHFGNNLGDLYPRDLQKILTLIGAADVSTLILLSSYSVQNKNTLHRIERAVSNGLAPGGFSLLDKVLADGQTISLIFGRGPRLLPLETGLQTKFRTWMKEYNTAKSSQRR